MAEGPAHRAHREGDDVHRAPAHRTLEDAVEGLADLGGCDPVVRGARIFLAIRGDVRARLETGDVAGVRAGEVRAGAPFGVQLDELALIDHLAKERIVLGRRAVDPMDAVGLGEGGHLVDPGDEGGQTGALDGGASAMTGAVRAVDACGGRYGARGGVEDVGECHVVLLG
ncbi:hypothetical protein QE454_000162 [Microbacterium sp. SORGH_AS454]|nr:hypothetical protein [Microbacterium sp. SORGH_AS_0454]